METVFLSLLSNFNFFFRSFLAFFCKTVVKDNKVVVIKKTKKTKNIISMLNSNFPNFISEFQLFKKFLGYNFKLLNNIKNKENFFSLLIDERFKIIFDRAFSIFKTIKKYSLHNCC